jgi:hypothetical protein
MIRVMMATMKVWISSGPVWRRHALSDRPRPSGSLSCLFIVAVQAGTRRRFPRMVTSGLVVHPGWLTAGPVSGTEVGEKVEMKLEVHIKMNRFSQCRSGEFLRGS